MKIVRELPTIIEEYRSLRKNFDLFCNLMSKNGYEEGTRLEDIEEDEEILKAIGEIKFSQSDAATNIENALETERGLKFARTNIDKWTKDIESNPYAKAKSNTLGDVFSTYLSALNIIKLEIGLCTIVMTDGKVEAARSLSSKAIRFIPATADYDKFIFNSAATIAKADGMKLDETKIK